MSFLKYKADKVFTRKGAMALGAILLISSILLFAAGCVSLKAMRSGGERTSRARAGRLPEELVFHARELGDIKRRIASGDKAAMAIGNSVIKGANAALGFKPVSVMDKTESADSGDKHDYLSLARYAWPDPDKPDGLPYIIRDGRLSPYMDTIPDKKNLGGVIEAAGTLAVAYQLTGSEKYAQKAAEILRVWFLDPATRMNPNGNYAQVVRGRGLPGGIGIIDFVSLAPINEFVALLDGSKAWTADDKHALREWMGDLLEWLRTSRSGKNEAAAPANHGTWYDTQVAAIALYLGKDELAHEVLEGAKTNRIPRQIDPDGRQPHETARTLGLHYSVYNLNALFRLSELGERAGVDLWHFQTEDGRSIRKALEWLMPYLSGDKSWPYKQIEPFDTGHACTLLFVAGKKYHDPRYSDLGRRLCGENAKLPTMLFQPD